MGERGTVPKRSDQRRRRNKPETPIDKPTAAEFVPMPPADEAWHPVAQQWFRSLAKSGQSIYYEPSDWAAAFLIAESMSRDLNPQFVAVTEKGEVVKESIPLKGASLGAYLRGFAVLLTTEGDRRRASLELQRTNKADADEDAAVAKLDDYRSRISG